MAKFPSCEEKNQFYDSESSFYCVTSIILAHIHVGLHENPFQKDFSCHCFLYEKVLNINLKDENMQALRAKQRIPIPQKIKDELLLQIKHVETIHEIDLKNSIYALCFS